MTKVSYSAQLRHKSEVFITVESGSKKIELYTKSKSGAYTGETIILTKKGARALISHLRGAIRVVSNNEKRE